jgi:hypothetical protein
VTGPTGWRRCRLIRSRKPEIEVTMTKGSSVHLTLFAVMTALAVPMGVLRADELRSKLEHKLVDIKRDLFDARGLGSVAVGEFSGAANLEASGGPAISNAMIDALGNIGLKVDRKARIEVAGRYRQGTINGLNSLRIHLQFEDNDAGGGALLETDIDIVDAGTIMRLAGGSGDISGQSRKEQSEKVGQILKKPGAKVGDIAGATVASTRIGADSASPYAIEVQVRTPQGDLRPRAAVVNDGQAFVSLASDDVYAVRVINDSDLDTAVILAVDGLSMFAFSDKIGDRDARLIIPKRSNSLIVGWYRNDGPKGSNEFLVSKLADAAVQKQMPTSSSQVGMVTATFAVAWPQDTPAPPGEEPFVPTRDDLATAIGKPVDQPFQKVAYLFGKARAAITVRYNKTVEPSNLPR